MQRGHQFAIVDEVDSILIDEARTPLIISGPAEESTDKYYRIDKIIPKLIQDIDYTLDEKMRTATLTEEGVSKCERLLNLGNLYDPANMDMIHHVYQGLRAHTLFERDVDYVVKDGEVVIVDEFTGRQMPGRRWSDGLHQAVEAKEGVKIERENQTLATITFQNYFRMYKKLSGMTGTAETEAPEFDKIYKLEVVAIPTNKPLIRIEESGRGLPHGAEKFEAAVNGIMQEDGTQERRHPAIFTRAASRCWWAASPSKSRKRSRSMLKKAGIPHQVLNAKQHEREAKIIAQAGRKGAVTVSTNMAGRGTDILLGGNPEAMTREYCLKNKLAMPYAPAGSRDRRASQAPKHPRRPMRAAAAGARRRQMARRCERVVEWRERSVDGAVPAGRQDFSGAARPVEADLRSIRRAVQGRARRSGGAWAACTFSAPSATRRGASTISCAGARDARAIPAPRDSSSRSKTICCAFSAASA